MRKLHVLATVLVCVVGSSALSAAVWDKKTKVTFRSPVEVPAPNTDSGMMVLAPGTYVFRLDDSRSNRHIVQVTNDRQDHVYTTVLAIPDYRLNASSKTVMYFSETKAGAPPAIKSWFYPGDNYGQRFVYPKPHAEKIAAAVQQPVPSHSENAAVDVLRDLEVAVVTPVREVASYTASLFASHDASDAHGEDGEAVREAPAPSQLPQTASPIYLFGLLGLLLIGVSYLVNRAAARV